MKVLFMLVLSGILLTSCSKESSKSTETKSAAPQGTPVDALVLKAKQLNDEMLISGTLKANQQVDLMSEMSRKVISVHVKEGSSVKKGTLLFKLEDNDLRAQLEQLKQQEKLAKLNEQRLKDLIEHQAVMQQDYDQTFTNLKVIEAQVQQINVSISKTSILAPFDGKIGIINVYVGALVSPGTSLATINDNSKVKLDFAIPEKYSSILKIGTQLNFNVESSSKTYEATIIARESELNSNTRNMVLRAIGPNPGFELIPGQSARIKLNLSSSENAIMIPNQALIPSSQGYSVFISQGNKANMKSVKVGQRNAFSVHVLSGLNVGDTLITSNMLRLIPGASIQLISVN